MPIRGVALAMHEPIGVIGIVCPDAAPLLGLSALVAPAIAMGNRVVVVPSGRPAAGRRPTSIRCSRPPTCRAASSTSSPAGARTSCRTLADHLDVEALWYYGPSEGLADVERRSTGNLKRVHTGTAADLAVFDKRILQDAVQVKNVWIPYGE